ncbi:MAG: GAF domain-containing protein [Bacteroidota bacterium]
MEEIKTGIGTKQDLYTQLLPQIISVVSDEPNAVANMANTVAALKQTFSYYSWVGFYLIDPIKQELVLGPFQGKIACTRIAFDKGVCGTAFTNDETVIVPDVNQFPGHIFCDGDSRSEIVVPFHHQSTVVGVLDVDSHEYNSFDSTDQRFLEQLLQQISKKLITA